MKSKPKSKKKIKKENAGAAATIPERGGLRRSGPRAREKAPLRSTPYLVPSRCEPGALESDPVARDPTRPQQRQLAIKVNAGGTPQRKHQRSGEIEAEIKKENQKRKRRRSCNDPRARRSAPLRSSRAREGAIKINAVSVDVDANSVVDMFSRNAFEGEFKYEGTNEIGPQMDIYLFKVAFKPSKSLNPISDEWGNIEIEGEALADDLGKFGTWTVREQVVGP